MIAIPPLANNPVDLSSELSRSLSAHFNLPAHSFSIVKLSEIASDVLQGRKTSERVIQGLSLPLTTFPLPTDAAYINTLHVLDELTPPANTPEARQVCLHMEHKIWKAEGSFKTVYSGILLSYNNRKDVTILWCAVNAFKTHMSDWKNPSLQNEVRLCEQAAKWDCAPRILAKLETPSRLPIFFSTLYTSTLETVYDLNTDDLKRICRELTRKLARMHDEGKMVHHDIKPANILIENDVRGKIITATFNDFGLAMDSLTPITLQKLGGTFSYFSPEKTLLKWAINSSKSYQKRCKEDFEQSWNKTLQQEINTTRFFAKTPGALPKTWSEWDKEAVQLYTDFCKRQNDTFIKDRFFTHVQFNQMFPSDIYALALVFLKIQRITPLIKITPSSYSCNACRGTNRYPCSFTGNCIQITDFNNLAQQLALFRDHLYNTGSRIDRIIADMLDPNSSTRITAKQAAEAFTLLSEESGTNALSEADLLIPQEESSAIMSSPPQLQVSPHETNMMDIEDLNTRNNPLIPPFFTTEKTDHSLQESGKSPEKQGCCVIA
ncbi:MAG: hypothetical protein RLZZ453_645 [Chlamydiota bacterium]|jgi:serine/threonine protein kinase